MVQCVIIKLGVFFTLEGLDYRNRADKGVHSIICDSFAGAALQWPCYVTRLRASAVVLT